MVQKLHWACLKVSKFVHFPNISQVVSLLMSGNYPDPGTPVHELLNKDDFNWCVANQLFQQSLPKHYCSFPHSKAFVIEVILSE